MGSQNSSLKRKYCNFLSFFLVAVTRLYTLPYRSVGWSVGRSVTFLNSEWFLHYSSCPTVRDWIAVYPALVFSLIEDEFLLSQKKQTKKKTTTCLHKTYRHALTRVAEVWVANVRTWFAFWLNKANTYKSRARLVILVTQCWDTMLGHNVGTQCWDTM